MEEIETVVKEFHDDRAPGPDGLIGRFLKNCWNIIKPDFCKMICDFFEGDIDIKSINTAYITLIPKRQSPENMNDYRTISLVTLLQRFLPSSWPTDYKRKLPKLCIKISMASSKVETSKIA